MKLVITFKKSIWTFFLETLRECIKYFPYSDCLPVGYELVEYEHEIQDNQLFLKDTLLIGLIGKDWHKQLESNGLNTFLLQVLCKLHLQVIDAANMSDKPNISYLIDEIGMMNTVEIYCFNSQNIFTEGLMMSVYEKEEKGRMGTTWFAPRGFLESKCVKIGANHYYCKQDDLILNATKPNLPAA